MNCEGIIGKIGFSCRAVGNDTLRVWSPFTYAGDGERIGFYVEKTNGGYRVTDNCEALMHASSTGLRVTSARLRAIQRAIGSEYLISDEGEIETFVSDDGLPMAMASVLNAALAVSHVRAQWSTRVRSDSFVRDVEDILMLHLPDRVLRKQSVIGASSHQIEFPLAVKDGQETIYIQPIGATDDDKVDWPNVYESWGRLTDLKHARVEGAQRLVVLQDAANDTGIKQAIGVLSDSSSVVMYSRLHQWAEEKRA